MQPRQRTARRARPRWGARRLAALGLVAVVLGAIAGSLPAGATTPTTEPPVTQRFGMTPTGANPSQPGERSTFQFHLADGHVGSDRVTLFNYGPSAQTFQVYANDAIETAEGQIDLKRADQKPTGAGAWVHLQVATVTVAPNHAVVIPFVVEVPLGARAGDHAAGIVASVRVPATTPTGQHVTVESRFGVPLYVRVAGPTTPKLSVVDLQLHYHRAPLSLGGGTLDVTWLVVNTGNVLLGTDQTVRVDAPFGWNLEHRKGPRIPELIPGGSVAQGMHFTNVFPAFVLTGKVALKPFYVEGPTHPAPPTSQATATVWAIPWILVIIVAVLIVLGYEWYRRRRNRAPGPTQTPAASPPAEELVP